MAGPETPKLMVDVVIPSERGVVLIRRGSTILGQIDIDSDVPDPFTADEEASVRRVADALAVLL